MSRPRPTPLHVEDLEFLVEHGGLTLEGVAARTRRSVGAVEALCRRSGRPDLLARMRANVPGHAALGRAS